MKMKAKFKPNISKSRASKGSTAGGGRSGEGESQTATTGSKDKQSSRANLSENEGCVPSEKQGS